MVPDDTIYEEFGVPHVINCVGTRTQVGGARVREGVMEAMERASQAHVQVSELQAAASKKIAQATGAEAGYVSAGAASGLLLSAAACMAGRDMARMSQLPNTDGIPDKILIPKAHRLKYDIGLRASGATLVDVGHVSHHPVKGGVDKFEPWQLEAAIDDETAAIAYVQRPHNVSKLETVTEIASEAGVPVIVDAASEVPPKSNFKDIVGKGPDLVVFSGGKGVRGPQSTGIVAGRSELIESIALMHTPDGYHEALWNPSPDLIDRSGLPRGTPATGIGRPMKVGPEEIVGLLTALDQFLEEDEEETLHTWRDRADRITTGLTGLEGLDITLSDGMDKASGVPKVIGHVTDAASLDALELIEALRNEEPHIWVGERYAHLDTFTIAPQELTDEEADYVVQRITTYF